MKPRWLLASDGTAHIFAGFTRDGLMLMTTWCGLVGAFRSIREPKQKTPWCRVCVDEDAKAAAS